MSSNCSFHESIQKIREFLNDPFDGVEKTERFLNSLEKPSSLYAQRQYKFWEAVCAFGQNQVDKVKTIFSAMVNDGDPDNVYVTHAYPFTATIAGEMQDASERGFEHTAERLNDLWKHVHTNRKDFPSKKTLL
ncbi:MAG: hypothetical protein KGJ02_07315 [Verrucomicrobiota bacterium]|nr:hypothetical protein [Verrucomicrobiota bacterium]